MSLNLSAAPLAGFSPGPEHDPLAVPDDGERLAWWTHARFGMFIHWGLFSAAGGTWQGKACPFLGCWMQERFRIPPGAYAAELMPKLSGERFDPHAIARMAEATGMRYVVAVAKHHDGFAMFDSDASDLTIRNAPARRDWIGELASAVRARGLKMGIYYSQNLDWSHAGGGGEKWDPAQQGDADDYVDGLVIPQLRELLSKYGEVSVLWFDIPGGVIDAARAARILRVVRSLQPRIVINNRLGGGIRGDFQTPEQEIPPAGLPGLRWEVCQTLNDTWEYTHYDRSWKTASRLIRELVDTASKGGNYLLNIGPKPDGSVPAATQDLFVALGRWMREHGEAIHGTLASPFPSALPWGRCTRRDLGGERVRLYLHIFRWPFDGVLRVPPLENTVLSVALLSSPGTGPLGHDISEDGEIIIRLPVSEPNDHASVVMVDLAGEPRIRPREAREDASGVIHLPAAWAQVERGSGTPDISGYLEPGVAQLCYVPETDSLCGWRSPLYVATWWIQSPRGGDYTVEIVYGSASPATVRGEFVIVAEDRNLEGRLEPTAGWSDFRASVVGCLRLPAARRVRIELRLLAPVTEEPFVVSTVRLSPHVPHE